MKLPELSLLALPGRHSPLLEFFVTQKENKRIYLNLHMRKSKTNTLMADNFIKYRLKKEILLPCCAIINHGFFFTR